MIRQRYLAIAHTLFQNSNKVIECEDFNQLQPLLSTTKFQCNHSQPTSTYFNQLHPFTTPYLPLKETDPKSKSALVKRCERINLLDYRRGRGRSKKSWKEMIKEHLNFLELTENMAQDRSLWKSRIQVVDYW